jgi:hypothetical protein
VAIPHANEPSKNADTKEVNNSTKPDQQLQETGNKKKKTTKRKDDLNELKKEVSMDEHKISLQVSFIRELVFINCLIL